MKQLNLLIKPVSSLCDMRCQYCFYEDVSNHRDVKNTGNMSEAIVKELICAAFSSVQHGGNITFGFQGGEPTLAGLSFFQTFVELERQYTKPGVTVCHTIQTNGLTLDESWAHFFQKHNFLVGLSMDGTKSIHDQYRLDATHSGTWNKAVSSLQLLQKYRVQVNLLCVVTKSCARSPQKVYNSLKKLGVSYLQFIPCLEPLDARRGEAPFALTPEAYGRFLCTLFDAWYLDWKAGQYVSIRLFDDYVHILAGRCPGSCSVSGRCGDYLVVEGDGRLYPCDFYVLDQWCIGNVQDGVFSQAEKNDLICKFVADKKQCFEECTSCQWISICRGGCKRDWYEKNGTWKNYYCTSFQQFFSYSYPRLCEIAQAEVSISMVL